MPHGKAQVTGVFIRLQVERFCFGSRCDRHPTSIGALVRDQRLHVLVQCLHGRLCIQGRVGTFLDSGWQIGQHRVPVKGCLRSSLITSCWLGCNCIRPQPKQGKVPQVQWIGEGRCKGAVGPGSMRLEAPQLTLWISQPSSNSMRTRFDVRTDSNSCRQVGKGSPAYATQR